MPQQIYEASKDAAPALILWFFDSRGIRVQYCTRCIILTHNNFNAPGGVSPSATPLPDWVDASVAPWIARETALMGAAWGTVPRGALAFVHIAPYALSSV